MFSSYYWQEWQIYIWYSVLIVRGTVLKVLQLFEIQFVSAVYALEDKKL
jgi:hypothetical protein